MPLKPSADHHHHIRLLLSNNNHGLFIMKIIVEKKTIFGNYYIKLFYRYVLGIGENLICLVSNNTFTG